MIALCRALFIAASLPLMDFAIALFVAPLKIEPKTRSEIKKVEKTADNKLNVEFENGSKLSDVGKDCRCCFSIEITNGFSTLPCIRHRFSVHSH